MIADSHIPILNYHKVTPQTDIGMTSRHPERFKQDMAALKEQGYRTVTFKDIALKNPLPDKPIIITFDDGYKSVLEQAFPIMQAVGFTAVVYMPTNFIGKNNDWDVQFAGKIFSHLSAEDLLFLHKHGFEIGSHGCSHRSLLALRREDARRELSESKRILEDLIGDTVVSVSYPFGRFDPWLLQQSKMTGYKFGVASIYWRNSREMNGFGLLAMRRFNVYRIDSIQEVLKKAQGNFHSILGYRDWLIQKGSMATVAWQKLFKK